MVAIPETTFLFSWHSRRPPTVATGAQEPRYFIAIIYGNYCLKAFEGFLSVLPEAERGRSTKSLAYRKRCG